MHTLHIKRMISLFPDARFIHIVRDPRAVVSSMLNTGFFKFADSLEHAVEQYRLYVSAVEPYSSARTFITLKYEDLSANTASTLRDVFSFLGLGDGCLGDVVRENHRKAKVDIEGVFRKGAVDSYKEDLSPGQVRYVEEKLPDLMGKYGYSSASPSCGNSIAGA